MSLSAWLESSPTPGHRRDFVGRVGRVGVDLPVNGEKGKKKKEKKKERRPEGGCVPRQSRDFLYY